MTAPPEHQYEALTVVTLAGMRESTRRYSEVAAIVARWRIEMRHQTPIPGQVTANALTDIARVCER